jgi:hypothetical protein
LWGQYPESVQQAPQGIDFRFCAIAQVFQNDDGVFLVGLNNGFKRHDWAFIAENKKFQRI